MCAWGFSLIVRSLPMGLLGKRTARLPSPSWR
jgi:hypothetical protein